MAATVTPRNFLRTSKLMQFGRHTQDEDLKTYVSKSTTAFDRAANRFRLAEGETDVTTPVADAWP